jgi:hypothetical protein
MDEVRVFPGGRDREHVICDQPLRLRWGDWRVRHILQVHVQSAAAYEQQRCEALAEGRDPAGQMPVGFELEGAAAQAAQALLRHRGSEERLVEVGYAAALMEALVHTPSAILRTDLVRRVYQEAEELSSRLGIVWRGDGRSHFLLPLNEDAREPDAFARRVAPLANLAEFFATLRAIAAERHQKLKKGYVLYYPRHLAL